MCLLSLHSSEYDQIDRCNSCNIYYVIIFRRIGGNNVHALMVDRIQFGVTTVYHFLFVPLTIGLAFLLAILETMYVRSGDEKMKKLIQFFGRLFLINFAIGVVTGILQEFQFGMNWSDYSRYVGDVFGAPLAVEALLAFFMESTFLGIWIFGWERVSKRLHLLSIWLVAFGTALSALWILTANSFMQEPVGYAIRNGHAEMTSFFALLGNPQLWVEFPHVIFGAWATASFFMLGISAYQLLRKYHVDLFKRAFKVALTLAVISSILVAFLGHLQAQHLVKAQPMKTAAAEGLWNTSPEHAPWSLIAGIDAAQHKNTFSVDIPYVLSILSYDSLSGKVQGMNELQQQYVQQYGPGNYIPPVNTTYWSFRIMVLAGVLMILFSLWGIVVVRRNKLESSPRFMRILLWSISLPFIANSMGWIMTEIGRQPWSVFGLLKTDISNSPIVSTGEALTTLIGFGVIYGIMAVIMIGLMNKYTKLGFEVEEQHDVSADITSTF